MRRSAGLLQDPALPCGVLAAILVGAILAQASQPLGSDAGWLLIATRRLLAGRRLYVEDFVDANPPLILYLLAPAVAAARALAVSEIAALRIYVFALAAGSIALCARLAAVGLSGGERTAARWWLVFAAFCLLLLDRRDFAQREHLIALFLTPYLAHASACARSCRPRALESIAAGLLAGLAVGLKPQYALVPCFALLGVFAAQRRLRVGVGPALAVLVLVVAADLLLLKPDYLRFGLPLMLETYGAYRNPLASLLRGSDLLLLAAAISLPLILPRATSLSAQARIFAPATAAAYGAYLVSGTGWDYHRLPFQMLALSTLSLAAVHPLTRWRYPVHALRPGVAAAAGAGAFAAVGVVLALAPLGIARSVRHRLEWRPRSAGAMAELRGLIDRHSGGGAIWVISLSLTPAFPVVNYAGVEWASRFSSLWPLPAVIRSRAEPTPRERRERLDAVERQVVAAVVEDLERTRPDLIVVPLHRQGALRGLDFDFLAFFQRDAGLARVWSDYAWVEDTARLRAYVRRE